MKQDAGINPRDRKGPPPPVHAFTSFWHKSMLAGNVKNWAPKVRLDGKQFFEANVVLFPVCNANHWILVVVKPKERTIECFDSLGGDGKKFTTAILYNFLQTVLGKYWVAEEWTVVGGKQRSSMQLNGSDCGVFTILNALAVLRGEEPSRVLSCDGMLEARKRIAATLLNGAPTTELD
jgi:Ulp1 family protease